MNWKYTIAPFALLAALATAAPAQEIHTSRGLVCDTAEQVTEFLKSPEDNPIAAVDAINARFSSAACELGLWAFAIGDEANKAKDAEGKEWSVRRVLVVAVGQNGRPPLHAVKPTSQFSAFQFRAEGKPI